MSLEAIKAAIFIFSKQMSANNLGNANADTTGGNLANNTGDNQANNAGDAKNAKNGNTTDGREANRQRGPRAACFASAVLPGVAFVILGALWLNYRTRSLGDRPVVAALVRVGLPVAAAVAVAVLALQMWLCAKGHTAAAWAAGSGALAATALPALPILAGTVVLVIMLAPAFFK